MENPLKRQREEGKEMELEIGRTEGTEKTKRPKITEGVV